MRTLSCQRRQSFSTIKCEVGTGVNRNTFYFCTKICIQQRSCVKLKHNPQVKNNFSSYHQLLTAFQLARFRGPSTSHFFLGFIPWGNTSGLRVAGMANPGGGGGPIPGIGGGSGPPMPGIGGGGGPPIPGIGGGGGPPMPGIGGGGGPMCGIGGGGGPGMPGIGGGGGGVGPPPPGIGGGSGPPKA